MELNKDCIDIILYLMNKKEFVKVVDLASYYKVTDRTIRYKLNKIELFFDKKGLRVLERNHLKGVRIILSKDIEEYITNFVSEYTPYQYIFSKEERFQIILMNLLQSKTPINSSYFENLLCTSRNTILKELESVKLWLKERDLTLKKKPKVGIFIEGSENIKRKSLSELKTFYVLPKEIQDNSNIKINKAKTSFVELKVLFSDIDMNFIDSIIREGEVRLKKQFTDEAYSGLATHLSIMIKRIKMNENIDLCPINIDISQNLEEYEVAKFMLNKIENKYNIKICNEELKYIMIHLLGAKVIKDNELNLDIQNENKLRNVVYKMINYFQTIYNLSNSDINYVKEKLINGLILHLRPTVYRLKYDLRIINPILDDIYIKYNELFKNTKIISIPLEEYIGKNINDHEIAYILMHFGAALRAIEEKKKSIPRVLLVCSSGIGTAKIMAAQLDENFQINVVDTIGSRSIELYDKSKCDLIITTVDIDRSICKNYIKINPLLTQDDYEVLKKVLMPKYNIYRDKVEDNLVNNILSIIKKYCVINNEQQLQCELMLEVKKDKVINNKLDKPSLSSLIRESTIKIKENCNTWEEAIGIGSDILMEHNAITDNYKKSIINNLKKHGPYMVIAPGVVLAHADIDCGVNDVAMSLVTLKYPIKFGSKEKDSVKLIITFSTTDREIHLKALSQLTEILSSEEAIRQIIKADTKAEILRIISSV